MPSFRQSWLTYVLGAILVALATFIFLNPIKARAGGIAELELSGGLGVSDDQVKSTSSGKTDLSQAGALGAVGLGYTYLRSDGMFLGAAGRFNLMHVVGDVGMGADASLKSDQLWEAYAKLGRCWHTALDKCKVAFYALAGWSWLNLDIKDSSSSMKLHPQGLLLGGGVDTHLSGPWYARLEYGWHNFNGVNVGGDKLNPDLHIVRVGLALKFGETARVPIVDDVIQGGCDTKLGNCKPVK